MSTMTAAETGASAGTVSLGRLIRGDESPQGASTIALLDITNLVCRGGWPSALNMTVRQASLTARSYIDAVASSDVSRVDGVRRDPGKVERLIASLARNESTLASNKTILADLDGSGVADSTLRDYLDALRRVYFVEDIPAWNPALRSPVRVRSSAKRHLADPSLAAAALGATPESLVNDLKTLGLLFESLVLHDLLVYAQTFRGRVMHYRDNADLEVDAIIGLPGGQWTACEIKLGAAQEDAAAASLVALERKMTARGERAPLLKLVIVGTGAIGRLRSDGVAVVPYDVLGA
jgi:hypothetical protein